MERIAQHSAVNVLVASPSGAGSKDYCNAQRIDEEARKNDFCKKNICTNRMDDVLILYSHVEIFLIKKTLSATSLSLFMHKMFCWCFHRLQFAAAVFYAFSIFVVVLISLQSFFSPDIQSMHALGMGENSEKDEKKESNRDCCGDWNGFVQNKKYGRRRCASCLLVGLAGHQ